MESDSGNWGCLPGKMQNRIGAIRDIERNKGEFGAGVIHIMVRHGFLQTHFQVVNAFIK